MEMDVAIASPKAFKDTMDYLQFLLEVDKEGTVTRELNCILSYTVKKAKEKGFTLSQEQGLGDFALDELKLPELGDFDRQILNNAGRMYYETGVYPIIYTCDEDYNPIEITMEELFRHNRNK